MMMVALDTAMAGVMVVVKLLHDNLTRSLRYVLDHSYTVQQLDPDTKAMKPLFVVPQGPATAVYRSLSSRSCA
jgi:hypothetical protein